MPGGSLPHSDSTTLERRRLKGLDLLSEGRSQAEVARLLGVTPAAVCYWKRAIEEGRPKALLAVPRPGRPTLVPWDRLAKLPGLLSRGALSYGYSTDLWTIARVVQIAEAEWEGPPSHPRVYRPPFRGDNAAVSENQRGIFSGLETHLKTRFGEARMNIGNRTVRVLPRAIGKGSGRVTKALWARERDPRTQVKRLG